ncbi:MAG: hypothetical protein ACE5I7_19190, partial [Candidatus Binatia bacterium]
GSKNAAFGGAQGPPGGVAALARCSGIAQIAAGRRACPGGPWIAIKRVIITEIWYYSTSPDSSRR